MNCVTEIMAGIGIASIITCGNYYSMLSIDDNLADAVGVREWVSDYIPHKNMDVSTSKIPMLI